MIQVETGIPIPLPATSGRRLYPWHELEVGQSFLATGGTKNSVAAGASAFGKKLGRKFRTSKVQGGIRVWRTA